MTYPVVSVTGDPVPSDRKISITVEVIEQFSPSSPAVLLIEFTNEAQTKREFEFGAVPPLGPFDGRSDAGNWLHAIPNDENAGAGPYPAVIPQSPIEGCWKLADTYATDLFGRLWPADSGATTRMTYAVLDEPDTEDCLPAGEYRMEDEWGERYPGDESVKYSWGFTVELQR